MYNDFFTQIQSDELYELERFSGQYYDLDDEFEHTFPNTNGFFSVNFPIEDDCDEEYPFENE